MTELTKVQRAALTATPLLRDRHSLDTLIWAAPIEEHLRRVAI